MADALTGPMRSLSSWWKVAALGTMAAGFAVLILGGPCQFDPECADGRFRRISPIVVRPGEGLLSDHIAGAHRGRRELLFMPHFGP